MEAKKYDRITGTSLAVALVGAILVDSVSSWFGLPMLAAAVVSMYTYFKHRSDEQKAGRE